MNVSKGALEARRRQLMEDIFKQRIDFANAYRDLGKPLEYTQKTVVGLKMLQQNAWLIALAPTAVNLLFSTFGWKKAPRGNLLGRLFGGERRAFQRQAQREAHAAKKPLMRWLGHGWRLFRIYRRVRRFFL